MRYIPAQLLECRTSVHRCWCTHTTEERYLVLLNLELTFLSLPPTKSYIL